MAFDPDEYLSSAPAQSGGFDPDSYLKGEQASAFAKNSEVVSEGPKKTVGGSLAVGARQGALMGYAPQVEAIVEAVTAKIYDKINNTNMYDELPDYVERRDKAAAKMKEYEQDNPKAFLAGNIGGAVASSIPLMAAVPLKGGGAGARVAQAAKAGGLAGAVANPGDTEGEVSGLQVMDRAKNAAIGATAGAALQGTGEAIVKGVNAGRGVVRMGGEFMEENLPVLKENAQEIIEAAKRQGIKFTPGMIYEGDKFQALEQSLAKSPSLFNRVGKTRERIVNDIEQAVVNNLDDASGLNNYEVGTKVKDGILKSFDDRLAPLSEKFNEVGSHTKHMGVSQKGVARVLKNAQNMDEMRLAKGTGSGVETKINQYSKMLENAKTVDDLKTIRTQLGKSIRSAPGEEQAALIEMQKKVTRLEQRNLERAAIEAARTPKEGAKIGDDLLGELKTARKGWAEVQGDIGELSKTAKLGNVQGRAALESALEKKTPEQISQQFFNTGDSRLLGYMKDKFPKEFEELRRLKIREISQDVTMAANGNINPTAFIRKINDIEPGLRELVLGSAKKVQNADDLKQIWQALPKGFNPSGTAQGMAWQDLVKANVVDLYRMPLYKSMTSGALKKTAGAMKELKDVSPIGTKGTIKTLNAARAGAMGPEYAANPLSPKLLDMISQNPDLLDSIEDEGFRGRVKDHLDRSPQATKGPAKWRADGLQKLKAHGSLSPAEIEKLSGSPKGQMLLQQASDLKPGSKAMDDVYSKIKKQLGEK